MNVLLAAGPESTTLFIVTVQNCGRPPARLAGQRHITVPLDRLQSTYRRLLLAGDTILSVTPCQFMGHRMPSLLTVPPAEATARPTLAEPISEQAEGPDPKEVLTKSLVDLTVESWRFAWRFARLLQQLAVGEPSRYQGQLIYFQDKLHEAVRDAGMKIVNVEGRQFDSGIAATPLNREDFGAEETLVVDRMLEPIITGRNGIMHRGTVMLKAAEMPSATEASPLKAPSAEETARPTLTEPMPEQAEGPEPKEVLTKSLVDLAVESWRFGKLFARLLQQLATEDRSRYRGQLYWFQEKLNEALRDAGMKIVTIEGHPFDPGLAVTPLNAGDFGAEDALVVDRMLEPIVMGPDGIVRMGTAILKEVES